MPDSFESLKSALADRYTIEHELGAGGMAIVYLATDTKLDRKVAIKVLRPELAAAMGIDRFVREVELTSQLEHPNILSIHDAGEADGFLYYVMPLVEGESLRDRLNHETQLPMEDALQIAKDVADALGHSHSKGIMHRDIKPENILLEGGRAVVADFGIARAVTMAGGEKLTQTGMAIGTPAYMSPEQAAGTGHVDHRTDIYALGCVLYEMLAGEAPYTGPTAQAVIAKSFSDPIPSIRRVRHAISEDIDAAIEKALDKTPADRFDSTERFVQALTGERPVRSSTRSSQRVGMNLWVGAAVAGAFLVAAGVGIRTIIGSSGEASEPVTVVMASTTVVGADIALASAIDIALENAMLESPHVTMLSPREIQLAFQALGREPEPALDQETALEIARRAGAAAVVQPSVLAVGSGYMINVRMLGSDGASLAVSQASAEREADLMPALDSLQIDMRRKLGESQGDLENSRSLLYVLTPSAEAFTLYVQSQSGPDPFGQVGLAEQALAVDSNFAVALVHLANVRQNVGLDYLAPTERLLGLADHLPAAHRLYVEASAAGSAERDFEKSVERYMLMLDILPSSGLASPEAWANTLNELVLSHMELGNFERATRVFDEWRDSIETGGAAVVVYYGNRSLLVAQQGDYADATRLRQEHASGGAIAGMDSGWVAAASRRWAEAADVFEQVGRAGSSPPEQLFPSLFLATVEAVRGRPRASRAEFERATNLARQIGLPDLVAAAQLLRAASEFYALDAPERVSVPLAAMFSAGVPEAGMLRRYHAHGRALAAAICADLPVTPQEGPVAQLDCGAPVTTDSIHDTIETLERLGWEALGAGDLQQAIDIGNEPRLARAGGVGLRARVPAAIAMERQGRTDSAAAFFQRLTETSFGFVTNAPMAFLMWGYGLRALVEIDGVGASQARERLSEQWADAEPEFVRRVAEPLLGTGR